MPPEFSPDRASSGKSPAPGRPPKKNRSRRIFFVALGILVGLGVVVRVAAPEILRRTAISESPKFINGHIELEKIDLSVLMGRVELGGLAVYSDGVPDAPLFRLQTLRVDIGWGALFEGRIHVESLVFEKPEVDLLINAEGRFNWETLPIRGEETPKNSENGETSDLVVRVDGASIRDAQLKFSDLRRKTVPLVTAHLGTLELTGFDLVRGASGERSSEAGGRPEWRAARLSISGWRIGLEPAKGKPVEFVLALHSEGLQGGDDLFPLQVKIESDAGQIELNTELALTPLSAKGTLAWTQLALPRLLDLAPVEGIELGSGESDGHLEIIIDSTTRSAAADGKGGASRLALSMAGKLGVRTLDLTVEGKSPLTAQWEALDIEVKKLSVAPIGGEESPPPAIDVLLSKVELARPNLEFVLAETAAKQAVPPAEDGSERKAATAKQNATGNSLNVVLQALKISDGSLHFEDRTLESPFQYNVGELEVTAGDLEWPALGVSKLDVSLGAGGSRPVRLTGAKGPKTGRFRLEIEGLPLLPFNPYAHELGVFITHGTLSLSSDVTLTGREYSAKNEVTFDGLSGRSTGKTFTKYFGVPLEVAITLLDDPFDKIQLAVPLNGGGDSADIETIQAIGTAFRRSLTNALATPIKMLVATVLPKSDEGRLTFTLIPFSAGQTKISEFAIGQLENYAQALSGTSDFYANLFAQINFGDARQVVPDFKWTPGEKNLQVAPDHPGYGKLMALANDRASAVASRLETQLAVPEGKIQVTAWTGVLIEGPAGIRIGISDGKLKRSLLKRATDRLKDLF